jgi:OmpA-OmpF porin, OOP family
MFPRLALLPIGLFIIWCFVCRQWYVCHIKQVCEDAPVVVDTTTTEVPDNRPLVFNWQSPEPVTRPAFAAFRDSLLKTVTDTSLFEITGQYVDGEPAPAGFANMGLARGEAIKKLFGQTVPADRIVVRSEVIAKPADAETKPFEAARFGTKPIIKPGEPPKVECIEGADNSLVVYFPYGKAQREVDIKIEECLENIVQFLKASPEKTVKITGHTDDAGTAEFNMELGMKRAQHIQGILVKNGIDRKRTTVESKGENEPAASNDTEEGTRLNRRAVLAISN